ncbi:MAG: zinc ABC transporter substrate-binding protein [Tannerellaceae bacterium]|jgi:zinc transport system substrate-binding protein|nr:zinc ABC transporter substrate-binding protein [Tannerellaceae bacterium]
MKRGRIVHVFVLLLLLAGCGKKPADRRVISVTIEPQRYFAEKIAGDRFTVYTVVPSGQSPETYDPTPQQMLRIGKSLAYLQIGYIGFEQAWMHTIRENNPDMEVFDLSKGVALVSYEEETAHRCDDESHHHHHHTGVDPHIWSSINGAKVIARNTLDAFLSLDSDHADDYRQNYALLMKELEETEAAVDALLRPRAGRAFVIYHPALTYLAGEYNLLQLCIEMEGKEPSPSHLKELVELSREHRAGVVFVQQEFDRKNAALIAKETGCRLVTINPLAYNWNEEMIRIAKALSDE